MTFAEAVKKCLSNYAVLSGRARRSEYWWFALFNFGTLLVVATLDGILGTYPLLYAMAALGLFLPALGAAVRRLHDTGRSGWWYLIVLIPFAGVIVFIVFAVQDSQADNQYGPNPKHAGGAVPPPYQR